MEHQTKAQAAIFTKMNQLMARVERPLSCMEEAHLIELLEQVEPGNFLADCIYSAMKNPDKHAQLVDMLAAQAMDDFITVARTIGMDATILLLRKNQ